jgi:subtilisin family serine protease
VRGIAPEADAVVLRVLPGGHCSTLVEAIDRCIEEEVDVINLGLCTALPSALVEQRLQRARQLGIACIAAVGNTGGAVAYPASSPAVLAVASVGHLGEFPSDSPHAAQPAPGVPIGPDGFFAARFSAHGWEIDVCGPGVAIVSTVPPGGYAAWDGTSAAAAHVSGLATLLLAHHPDFAGTFRARTAARVDRLFDILRRSARPLAIGDPRRTGVGLPDALAAFSDVMAPVGSGATWSPAGMRWTGDTDPHQAGIVNGNGGHGKGGDPAAPTDALAQLRETLEQAGLWKER